MQPRLYYALELPPELPIPIQSLNPLQSHMQQLHQRELLKLVASISQCRVVAGDLLEQREGVDGCDELGECVLCEYCHLCPARVDLGGLYVEERRLEGVVDGAGQ